MDTSKPDWLLNHEKAKKDHLWKPGKSANPAGRPPGIIDRRHLLAKSFLDDAESIGKIVVAAALKGDMQAANLVLSRVQPVLKARAEKVKFTLDPDATPTEQSRAVVVAIAAGEIDAETGRIVLECIATHINMRTNEEVLNRLAVLERRSHSLPHGARGGVVEMEPAALEQLQASSA